MFGREQDKARDRTPDPGQYKTSQDFGKNTTGVTFNKNRRQSYRENNPGPGQYNANLNASRPSGPSVGIRGGAKGRELFLTSEAPAPGSYNV